MPDSSTPGCVLLVDDDERVLHLLIVCLKRAGYQVLTSLSAREALAQWDREQDRVELLITDVDLGADISGVELAHSLVKQKPSLKIIYMSGGEFESLGPDGRTATCIAKPFSIRTLAPMVKRALAEKAGVEPGPD